MKPITREEVAAQVRKILDAQTEEEADALLLDLESRVPHPAISDLIFLHKPELSPEEIADQAIDYRPLVTPPRQRSE